MSDSTKTTDVFYEFFANFAKYLNSKLRYFIWSKGIDDTVLRSIEKYKKHPSIKAIASIS